MRIIKYLAFAFIGLSTLLAGGVWYAQSHASDWAKKYAQEFGQSIGYVIDFNDLKLGIRKPSIALSELKITEVANQHQLIQVKDFQVSASWAGLLQKKITIDSVQIDQAHILAEKYPDNWNWLKFIAAVQKKFPSDPNKKPGPPKEFLIKDLQFKDGSIKIDEPVIKFKTELKPLQFDLKNTTNITSKGGVGGLETKYGIDLGQVSIPVPKKNQQLVLGHVLLGGDLLLDTKQDMVLVVQAKIDQGVIDATTRIFKTQNKIESDIQLSDLSLVPFIDLLTPKVSRVEKTGNASGQFKLVLQDKKLVLDGDVEVDRLSVIPFMSLAPTVNTINAKSGDAKGAFKIHYDPENTKVEGDIKLSQLAIYEPDKTSELLGWKSANVDKFYFEENPRSSKLRVEDVKIDGLKGRFVIYGDKSSNFRRMFQPSKDESRRIEEERKNAPLNPPPPTKTNSSSQTNGDSIQKSTLPSHLYLVANTVLERSNQVKEREEDLEKSTSTKNTSGKKPMNFNMKSIQIQNGKIEFTDFSIKPNFKTNIENFHGTLIGISTYPKRYATGAFEGIIPPSGDMKLKAKIAFEDARRNNDMNVSFRRIPLASINPYYTTFAGYAVNGGTLSYDSRFLTQDGMLNGDNRFIINQMQLGDKVPDYKGKNIPLELIVALLEDENGVIDLNLKVAGNVDKPDFKVGDLIWDALWTIVGNVVTAPFKMLGRLMGIEGHTGIYFEPGKSTLRPSETLKLESLVAGMQKKPKVKLNINGVYDADVDKLNLNTEIVDREIFKNAGFQLPSGEPLPQLPLEDERVQRAMRRIYSTSIGAIPPDINLKAGPEGLEGWKKLHEQLVAKGKVSEEDLQKLADTRALVIKNEITKINQAMESRAKIVQSKQEPAEKDGIPVGIEIVSN